MFIDLFGSQEEALEEDVIMSEEEKEPVFKLVKDNTLNKSRVLKHVSKQYYDGEFMGNILNNYLLCLRIYLFCFSNKKGKCYSK